MRRYFTKILKATDGKMAAGNSVSGAPYLEMHIGEITAEDDRGASRARIGFPLPDGTTLNPQFHLFFKIRDGKIAVFKDYVDSDHLNLGLAGDLKPDRRDSNVFEVTPRHHRRRARRHVTGSHAIERRRRGAPGAQLARTQRRSQ